MEPITRKELFMAKAAGENVNVPEPITREEMFLKRMADNSVSKYFVEQTETLLDKEYDIDNSSTKRDPLAVTAGDNVRVTFDGAEYNCTVLSMGNYLSIGNEAVWAYGGKDTGEPFCIHVTISGSTFIRVHPSNVGTHSVKVEKILGETIDHKFLPEGYPYEESAVLFDQRVEIVSEECMIEGALPISAGDLVKVTWNGAEYECTAFTGANNLVFFGNTGFMGGEDNGIPFAMATATIDGQGMFGIIAPHFVGQTVSVKVEGLVVKTIDPKFIPSGVGGGVVIVQDSAMASGVMPAGQAAPTATMNAAQIAEAVLSGKTVYFLEPNNQALLPFVYGYRFGEMASGVMTAASSPDPFALFGSADEEGWYVGVKVVLSGAYYTFDYGIKTE